MRLINKQKHNTTCGPTAILNAARVKGKFIPYNTGIKRFTKNGSLKDGMWPSHLTKELRRLNIRFSKTYNPKVKDIYRLVKKNNQNLILCYKWYRDGYSCWHYVFFHNKKIYNAGIDKYNFFGKLRKYVPSMARHYKSGDLKLQMWVIQ
jgi:hypothetical protein